MRLYILILFSGAIILDRIDIPKFLWQRRVPIPSISSNNLFFEGRSPMHYKKEMPEFIIREMRIVNFIRHVGLFYKCWTGHIFILLPVLSDPVFMWDIVMGGPRELSLAHFKEHHNVKLLSGLLTPLADPDCFAYRARSVDAYKWRIHAKVENRICFSRI